MQQTLPEYLTVVVEHCDDPEVCDCGAVTVHGPGNGPFGDPTRGFRLWTEFFPT